MSCLTRYSDESGRTEVCVRPSTPSEAGFQVSVNGGRKAVWSRDGQRLYYFEEDRIVEASLVLDANPRLVSRVVLFSGRYLRISTLRRTDDS